MEDNYQLQKLVDYLVLSLDKNFYNWTYSLDRDGYDKLEMKYPKFVTITGFFSVVPVRLHVGEQSFCLPQEFSLRIKDAAAAWYKRYDMERVELICEKALSVLTSGVTDAVN